MNLTKEQKRQAFRDFTCKNAYRIVPYLLNDGKKHPVAVICPGGGYSAVCSFVEGKPFAEKLNQLGYHAVVVCYRVRKKARFPAPQEDLARAVRDVLEHAGEWNLDTDGYSVWGASAGGHLAASFGTESMGYVRYGLPKPGALILTYPVVTMGELTHMGSRYNLLGKAPAPELVAATSVERQITKAYPPTFIWYGEADKTVDPRNSRMLFDALNSEGIPCMLEKYPGIDHGVGLGEGLCCDGWLEKAVQFWERFR